MTKTTCAAFILLALMGCNNPTSIVQNEHAQSISKTDAPAPPPVAIGKAAEAGGIAFTVTEVTMPKQIGSVGVGPRAEEDETFVVIAYKLKNVSGQPLPPGSRPTLTLIDPSGQSYEADEMAGGLASIHMDDTGSYSADLNPNVSAKDAAAWKLDAKAFDRDTWRLAISTDPQLKFALK